MAANNSITLGEFIAPHGGLDSIDRVRIATFGIVKHRLFAFEQMGFVDHARRSLADTSVVVVPSEPVPPPGASLMRDQQRRPLM